jgi:hypothetical protein
VRVRGMLMMWHCHVSSIPPPSSEHAAEGVLLPNTTQVACGLELVLTAGLVIGRFAS